MFSYPSEIKGKSMRLRSAEERNIINACAIISSLFSAPETIRSGLAMGADSGIHIQTDMRLDQDLQPLAVAKIFAKIFKDKNFDLAVLGKQSIDDDYNQTGQLLASLLGIPSATFASKIELDAEQRLAQVTREVDFGLQKI